MIDRKAYNREVKGTMRIDKPIMEVDVENGTASIQLSDAHRLISNITVSGFSFTAKKFLLFLVNNISPIPDHGQHSFDELTLDSRIKTMLQKLAVNHTKKVGGISYNESGRGQGLICLLHGPHGAGKTLTAECIAKESKRPLYPVSAGELGTTSDTLEKELTRIMQRAVEFKALLLIDDVDVFLQRQESFDFQHNAMITTFLRMLDSYTGLLFLTTTRVTDIDSAFLSRIHIPIFYEKLTPDSRLAIWLRLYEPGSLKAGVAETDFQRWAQHGLNGRQINNIMNMAEDASGSVTVDRDLLKVVVICNSIFEKQLAWEGHHRRSEKADIEELFTSDDQRRHSGQKDEEKNKGLNVHNQPLTYM